MRGEEEHFFVLCPFAAYRVGVIAGVRFEVERAGGVVNAKGVRGRRLPDDKRVSAKTAQARIPVLDKNDACPCAGRGQARSGFAGDNGAIVREIAWGWRSTAELDDRSGRRSR